MNECRLVEYSPCKVFGIIISAVLGLIAGILFFNVTITVTSLVLWFAAIAAAGALALLLGAAFAICCCGCENIARCFCRNIWYLIAGSVGSLVAAILLILLGIPVGFAGAVIFGILVFFAGLLITGIICFLLCVCNKECGSGNNAGANNNNCCCCCCSCHYDCENIAGGNDNQVSNCKIC